MERNKWLVALGGVGSLLVLGFLVRTCGKTPAEKEAVSMGAPLPPPNNQSPATPPPRPDDTPLRTVPTPLPASSPKRSALPSLPPRAPVRLHTELIPREIDIVRFYFSSNLMKPGQSIPFNINGSGFTREFEKMIRVESGHGGVKVVDLALVTPNQIHGFLVADPFAHTQLAFPVVAISGKPVFRSDEPFAVIRPRDVLNMMFTEIGESGQSGRFRIFTNLDEAAFKTFAILPSHPAIRISNLTPSLPFLVEGDLSTGPDLEGAYGLQIQIDGKTVWEQPALIQIVHPHVGETGLVQRVEAVDAYARPGDTVAFRVQGSGLNPSDASLLRVSVPGVEDVAFAFTYLSAGRMDLALTLPLAMAPGAYTIDIGLSDQGSLLRKDKAFVVVPPHWIRSIRLKAPLKPGASSVLEIHGRDMTERYVAGLRLEGEEPGLKLGPVKWISDRKAERTIEALPAVAPGDYWFKVFEGDREISLSDGSVIAVTAP